MHSAEKIASTAAVQVGENVSFTDFLFDSIHCLEVTCMVCKCVYMYICVVCLCVRERDWHLYFCAHVNKNKRKNLEKYIFA